MTPRPETDTFGFLVADVARLIRQEFDRHISEAGLGITPETCRCLGEGESYDLAIAIDVLCRASERAKASTWEAA